jgi:hypothetical protein
MLIILAEIGRTEVPGSLGKKFMRPGLHQQLDVVVCGCHPRYDRELKIGRIAVQANLGKK